MPCMEVPGRFIRRPPSVASACSPRMDRLTATPSAVWGISCSHSSRRTSGSFVGLPETSHNKRPRPRRNREAFHMQNTEPYHRSFVGPLVQTRIVPATTSVVMPPITDIALDDGLLRLDLCSQLLFYLRTELIEFLSCLRRHRRNLPTPYISRNPYIAFATGIAYDMPNQNMKKNMVPMKMVMAMVYSTP